MTVDANVLLVPRTDNYSDIGGFIAGLLLGVLTVPALPRKRPWATVSLWIARIVALGCFIALSVLMTRRFYAADDPDEVSGAKGSKQSSSKLNTRWQFCPFCRYISCLPLQGQCDSSDLL